MAKPNIAENKNTKIKNKLFKFYLFLAKLGFFKHDGLIGYSNFPKSRVLYADGKYSHNMEIGIALDYSELFSGTVVEIDYEKYN